MKQEDKELLLKDLCGRLPYEVKVAFFNEDLTYHSEPIILTQIECVNKWNCSRLEDENGNSTIIEFVKPYLFPLSSMTEEQYEKFIIISGWDVDIEDVRRGKFSCIGYVGLDEIYDAIDWFNKNHFDYRGLIRKGIANDATGLNIY